MLRLQKDGRIRRSKRKRHPTTRHTYISFVIFGFEQCSSFILFVLVSCLSLRFGTYFQRSKQLPFSSSSSFSVVDRYMMPSLLLVLLLFCRVCGFFAFLSIRCWLFFSRILSFFFPLFSSSQLLIVRKQGNKNKKSKKKTLFF